MRQCRGKKGKGGGEGKPDEIQELTLHTCNIHQQWLWSLPSISLQYVLQRHV